ncbi:MAG: type IV toxin-antitoxin system AbiEi family antitoxin domain-containing protein [Candidatus Falkowbacteria bacterium]
MNKLISQIKKIPKNYFSINDIKKISSLTEESLKVALSRMVKRGEIVKLARGLYANDLVKIDWGKLAVEYYHPSYLSFEWALARYNILSQQPHQLTLATTKRSETAEIRDKIIIYHRLKINLFWGYINKNGILIAEPEKAFLDLAYLSLNGYAKFDPDEMNLELLNKSKLKKYLKKFDNKKLGKLINKNNLCRH